MKIVMSTPISGTRDGRPWPAVGETADLPDTEAEHLIEQGYAEKPKRPKSTAAKTKNTKAST